MDNQYQSILEDINKRENNKSKPVEVKEVMNINVQVKYYNLVNYFQHH